METVFGGNFGNLKVSATKSMTGHLLGAAGAIEAILAVKAIEKNTIPPTINTVELDPEIPTEISIVLGEAIDHKVNVAMSSTFGFGGHNAIVAFKGV
jgi:3-oxoacyl-[acyl-carrier-protein] synthase II